MKLDYVPLLPVQRELHTIPRTELVNGKPRRFLEYLRTMTTADGNALTLPPLVAINPMAKDHVTGRLDELLAVDADGIAARAASEAATELADEPGEFKATLIVVDDWMGPWTNRAAHEFDLRFRQGPAGRLPRWATDHWIAGVVYSSEPVTDRAVREAIRAAVFRVAYVRRHGAARTLRDMLAQEGWVMARAGCTTPALDSEDIQYTREVLVPYLDATDMRTAVECLFGDEAARALGFTPRGLSPWAGLALALHDARAKPEPREPMDGGR
jgi:hypothetical protein